MAASRASWRMGLFALTLASMGCAGDDSGAEHALLHGTVRDGESGKRLSGVQVEFLSDTLERASDVTNSEGNFRLDAHSLTPNGRLTASKSGYETRVVSVFLDDADVSIDIELMRR